MHHRNIPSLDYSTIKLERLHGFGEYELPSSFSLNDTLGSACFLNPPGHPTYFLRSIYNRGGNNPSHGPQQVITDLDGNWKIPVYKSTKDYSWEKETAWHDRLMKSLWNPLPIDHLRSRAWINALYVYFHNCYSPDGQDRNVNRCIVAKTGALEAQPEHHLAVLAVQKHYPSYNPELDLIEQAQKDGNWWESLAEKPTPENCLGDNIGKHPVSKTWCQACGWRAES